MEIDAWIKAEIETETKCASVEVGMWERKSKIQIERQQELAFDGITLDRARTLPTFSMTTRHVNRSSQTDITTGTEPIYCGFGQFRSISFDFQLTFGLDWESFCCRLVGFSHCASMIWLNWAL